MTKIKIINASLQRYFHLRLTADSADQFRTWRIVWGVPVATNYRQNKHTSYRSWALTYYTNYPELFYSEPDGELKWATSIITIKLCNRIQISLLLLICLAHFYRFIFICLASIFTDLLLLFQEYKAACKIFTVQTDCLPGSKNRLKFTLRLTWACRRYNVYWRKRWLVWKDANMKPLKLRSNDALFKALERLGAECTAPVAQDYL